MAELPTYGERPRLRGLFHGVAAAAYAVWLPFLLAAAPGANAWWSTLIFNGGLVVLFTISALYHRVAWSPRGLARMRRLDHGYIFVLIACVYVPFCRLALPPATGAYLLGLAWFGAALGVARVLAWPYAPKAVSVTTYTLLPLLAAPYLPQIFAAVGPAGTAYMVAGNTVVALGAVAYAYGRPNPLPGVLGAHELFHAAVVACAVCYTLAVAGLVRGLGT